MRTRRVSRRRDWKIRAELSGAALEARAPASATIGVSLASSTMVALGDSGILEFSSQRSRLSSIETARGQRPDVGQMSLTPYKVRVSAASGRANSVAYATHNRVLMDRPHLKSSTTPPRGAGALGQPNPIAARGGVSRTASSRERDFRRLERGGHR
jgi:hypothetical protein